MSTGLVAVNGDGNLPIFQGYGRNAPDISIEHIFVIVISDLHDLVVKREGDFTAGDAAFSGVESCLQFLIQICGAERSSILYQFVAKMVAVCMCFIWPYYTTN